MNDPKLTDEQRVPMAARGVSIALASGAGCGKTTVLTERFLGLLEGEGRLHLSRIVALTFTEKAARELRDRVRLGCRRRMEADVDRPYWRSVLRGLETAKISTFHSFCSDVLRRFAVEAGIDPAFAILDETLAPTFRERSLETSMRRWLAARDPNFAALAVDYGLSPIREALGDILQERPAIDLDDLASLQPREVVARWEAYQARQAFPMLERFAEAQQVFLGYLARNPSSQAEMAARCARLIAGIPLLPSDANPVAALKAIREDAKVLGAPKKHWPSEEVYEYVKLIFTRIRATLDKLIDLLRPDEGRSLAAAESGVRLARLARDAISSYDETKAASGLLDFHDLQDRVQKLLRDGPQSVGDALRSSIDALLVDEFQDTDAVQAEILESLAGADATSGRLFLVGDAKQSIYGFRGAEPMIFQSFRDRFTTDGRLNLTENFRSVPAILGFVNRLFADAFPGAEHQLRAGGSATSVRQDPAPAVEFLWAGRKEKSDATLRRKVEASIVGRMLALRLKAGWQVRDRQTRTTRDARPGDVAILFRSRSDFPTYEQALAAVGLDYHVVGGSTYFAQQEVIDLMNLLSAIEDPLDSLALAGVLRGPFFGVSDEGLYWLANSGSAGFVEAFAACDRMNTNLSPDDALAVETAAATLRRWRDRKDKMPIAELLDRALAESGFEAALMGEFLGDRKRANVRKLVGLARRFDARGALTLADFVARLRADVKNPPREEQAATSDEAGQAIRLMTIHQAKGLEFPIVVLADLDRKAPSRSDLVTHHPELGFLVRPRGDADGDETATGNLGRDLASIEKARANEDEAIRVFYVATTRARDALILAAGRAPDDPLNSAAMRLLASTFDLATGASLAETEPGSPGVIVNVIDPIPIAAANLSTVARFRPKLLLTARTILRANLHRDDGPRTAEPKSRSIDLSVSSRLPQSLRDVDRLLRAVLVEPASWCSGDPASVVELAAERIGVLVPLRIKSFAADQFRRWQETPAYRELAGDSNVRCGLRWSLEWPLDDECATVFVGRIDFARLDAAGSWHLIQVAGDGHPARDRLNLLLAAHALAARAITPVVSADLVMLREDRRGERIVDFGGKAVSRAVAALASESEAD